MIIYTVLTNGINSLILAKESYNLFHVQRIPGHFSGTRAKQILRFAIETSDINKWYQTELDIDEIAKYMLGGDVIISAIGSRRKNDYLSKYGKIY